MKNLYKFHWDCGRQGNVTSIFVAHDYEIKDSLGKEVYFGEILGKHSEIYGVLENSDITVLTNDQDFIEKFEKYVGESTEKNPLNCLKENE